MMQVTESRLLPNLSQVHRYTARDVCDLVFLYMLGLHLCRLEFETAPWVRSYATKSLDMHAWHQTNLNKTDLHQLLNMVIAKPDHWLRYLKNASASELLMQEIHVDAHICERFLHNLIQVNFNSDQSARYLLIMERALKITTSNYKSMRRILADWPEPHVTTDAKSLVMTRLLQAIRAKAHRGELMPELERLSKIRKWEIVAACDPETGKNCDASQTSSGVKKPPSLLKQLAVGAGLGVGAYLLGKAMFGGNKK